jgi:cytochrome c oxidase assembly factor CtaG/cytochrome c2
MVEAPLSQRAFDPLISGSLALFAALYAAGVWRMWRRAGRGQGVRGWEAACFAFGWISLAAALQSPMAVLAELLFSVHMTQHEVLMLVAAPLIVLGRPLTAILWALPAGSRRGASLWTRRRAWSVAWRAVTGPLTVFLLHGAALWIWHLPSLYQAALGNPWIHAVQHLSFVLTSALFWWALLHGRYGRAGYGVGVFYVFATAIHTGALGALLTFAPRVLYPVYTARAGHLHGRVNPLEDQQLGGLLMWVPFGVVFVVAGLAMFLAWMGESERRVRIAEGSSVPSPPIRRGSSGAWALAAALLATAAATSCSKQQDREDAERLTGGRVARAPNLIDHYGCGSCHSIPGVPGATGTVGPPMDHMASRSYIAGRLPNEPASMISWLRSPQHFEPSTAMPQMGVTEADARDIAAYLYTLR